MIRRYLVTALVVPMGALWLAPVAVAGQPPATDATAFRTPWGDPDLQGIWSYATITPLRRPGELAGREFLTFEEVVELPLTSPAGYVIYEYAFHEGNISIAHVLTGARAQEKTAREGGR